MKKIALLFILAFVAVSVNAQNLKFGHINTTELVALMSDTDSAMVKLKAYQTELEEEMEAMQVEYNNKLNTYQQKAATWTAAIIFIRIPAYLLFLWTQTISIRISLANVTAFLFLIVKSRTRCLIIPPGRETS